MKRLLEGSLPPKAITLLRSAAADVPPRAAQEKARLASVVPSVAAVPSVRSHLSSGKWLGVLSLVVATSGVLGSAYYLSSSAPAPQQTAASVEEPALASPAPSAENIALPAPLKSVDVRDLPSAPRPSLAPSAAHLAEATARATAAAPALEDELKAIDEARAAFVDRNPSLALERVKSYRQKFPAASFMDEAEALEIQSLVALGRNEEARTKADRFLAARPESPYAQRVRSAVGLKK